MKKLIIGVLAASLIVVSCKKDRDDDTVQEVESLTEQNANDDAAIAKYMNEHYLDGQGLIKAFSDSDTTDDANKKLSDYDYQKLDSGVIVIAIPGAQPENGRTIGATDVIKLMSDTNTFLSDKGDDGTITYTSTYNFTNTISTTGVPDTDPYYYYVKKSVMESSGEPRSYYEIEGFQEGLKYFKSFDIPDSQNFNMQGVIIVPSRAAYARDAHYTSSYRNRTFVFNFQVYKSYTRPTSEE